MDITATKTVKNNKWGKNLLGTQKKKGSKSTSVGDIQSKFWHYLGRPQDLRLGDHLVAMYDIWQCLHFRKMWEKSTFVYVIFTKKKKKHTVTKEMQKRYSN